MAARSASRSVWSAIMRRHARSSRTAVRASGVSIGREYTERDGVALDPGADEQSGRSSRPGVRATLPRDDPTTTAAGPDGPRRAEGPGGPIRAGDPARPRSRASSSPPSACSPLGLFVGILSVYASFTSDLPTSPRSRTSTSPRARPSCPPTAPSSPPSPSRTGARSTSSEIPQVMIDAQVAAEDQTLLDEPVRRLPQHRAGRCSRTSRPARRSRAPRPSASSWSACASSTPSSWPIRSARSSARSRRRSSPCASTTATPARRASSASSRCT